MRALVITYCFFVGLMKIGQLLWWGVRNLAILLYQSYKYLRDLPEKKAAKANQGSEPELTTPNNATIIKVNSQSSIETISNHSSRLISENNNGNLSKNIIETEFSR